MAASCPAARLAGLLEIHGVTATALDGGGIAHGPDGASWLLSALQEAGIIVSDEQAAMLRRVQEHVRAASAAPATEGKHGR